MTFNLGNAIKYLWRNGLKTEVPQLQDLQKAVWYIEREMKRICYIIKPKSITQDEFIKRITSFDSGGILVSFHKDKVLENYELLEAEILI